MKKVSFLLAIPLILTSCQTMQSIDKGIYGITDQVSSRDRVTGARTLNMADRTQQIQKGNAAGMSELEKYTKAGKSINEKLDSVQYVRAKRIFSRLHRVSHMKDESWEVYLIPEDSFNAFVTGGTKIFIHEGLMKQLKSDDEVAAVLGHEMAHVAANHVFERQAGYMAAMLSGSNSAKSNAVQAAYSRTDESEADRIGILYMALAGYDPHAAAKIWNDIYKVRGNNGQAYNSHPISSERMAAAETAADKVGQYYKPGMINSTAPQILDNNTLYNKQNNSVAAGQGGGLLSALETFGNFYVQKQTAKQGAVAENNRIAVLQDIQRNMQITGGDEIDLKSFGMDIRYNGYNPVRYLAIKATTSKGSSIYRFPGTLLPGNAFTAIFDSAILETINGTKPKVSMQVDEGEYIR